MTASARLRPTVSTAPLRSHPAWAGTPRAGHPEGQAAWPRAQPGSEEVTTLLWARLSCPHQALLFGCPCPRSWCLDPLAPNSPLPAGLPPRAPCRPAVLPWGGSSPRSHTARGLRLGSVRAGAGVTGDRLGCLWSGGSGGARGACSARLRGAGAWGAAGGRRGGGGGSFALKQESVRCQQRTRLGLRLCPPPASPPARWGHSWALFLEKPGRGGGQRRGPS